MTRVAINGALPRDLGTGFAEFQEWEFEATCQLCLVWKAFCRCRLGPDGALGVPDGVWLDEDSQRQGSDCRFREAD